MSTLNIKGTTCISFHGFNTLPWVPPLVQVSAFPYHPNQGVFASPGRKLQPAS